MLITAAARLAACQFNHGSMAFVRALEVTRTPGGKHSLSAFQSLDDVRITASNQKATGEWNKTRWTRKKYKKKHRDRQEQQEGPTYNPGAFGHGDDEGIAARGRGRGRRGEGKGKGRGSGRGRGKVAAKSQPGKRTKSRKIIEK